jgi:hypothetical protein
VTVLTSPRWIVKIDPSRKLTVGVSESVTDLGTKTEVPKPRAWCLVGVPTVTGAVGCFDFSEEV